MGTYNLDDIVTGEPVRSGDQAMIFPVEYARDRGVRRGPFGQFKLVSLPVVGQWEEDEVNFKFGETGLASRLLLHATDQPSMQAFVQQILHGSGSLQETVIRSSIESGKLERKRVREPVDWQLAVVKVSTFDTLPMERGPNYRASATQALLDRLATLDRSDPHDITRLVVDLRSRDTVLGYGRRQGIADSLSAGFTHRALRGATLGLHSSEDLDTWERHGIGSQLLDGIDSLVRLHDGLWSLNKQLRPSSIAFGDPTPDELHREAKTLASRLAVHANRNYEYGNTPDPRLVEVVRGLRHHLTPKRAAPEPGPTF